MNWLHSRRVALPHGDGFRLGEAYLGIEAGFIRAIRPTPPPDAAVDSVGNALITPAFVDAHTHLSLTCARGFQFDAVAKDNMVEDFYFKLEAHVTPEDVRAFVRIGAIECLLHGTGLVWDHYYYPDAVVAGLQDAGLAGVVAPALQDIAGPGKDDWEANLEATTRLSTSHLRAGITTAVGPHATDTVSDALMAKAAQLADAHQLPVHLHVAQSLREVERLHERSGRTPMGHLRATGVLDAGPHWHMVHALFVTRDDLQRVDPSRETLVFCPASQAIFGFPAIVTAWEREGVPWVVATDAASSNDTWAVQQELRFMASVRSGGWRYHPAWRDFHDKGRLKQARALWTSREEHWDRAQALGDPARMLQRAWTLPGALHPALPAGAIAPGHVANLVVWDTDHPAFWPFDADPLRALVYGSPAGAIHQMMVMGNWRTPRGAHAETLLGNTWRTWRIEANARWAALRQRAKM